MKYNPITKLAATAAFVYLAMCSPSTQSAPTQPKAIQTPEARAEMERARLLPGIHAEADFDKDGIPDLAILLKDALSVQYGKGGPSYGEALDWIPHTMWVDDLDHDNNPDIILAGHRPEQRYGNGDGTFRQD